MADKKFPADFADREGLAPADYLLLGTDTDTLRTSVGDLRQLLMDSPALTGNPTCPKPTLDEGVANFQIVKEWAAVASDNMPTDVGGTGVAEAGVAEEYSRADHHHEMLPASATTVGGLKVFGTVQTAAAAARTATASRTYGVQLNSSGQAVVNVPWKTEATAVGLTAADEVQVDANRCTAVGGAAVVLDAKVSLLAAFGSTHTTNGKTLATLGAFAPATEVFFFLAFASSNGTAPVRASVKPDGSIVCQETLTVPAYTSLGVNVAYGLAQ
jgi:hypothetical protein